MRNFRDSLPNIEANNIKPNNLKNFNMKNVGFELNNN